MVENLNVDKYRNGNPIIQVMDQKEWAKLTKGAWCYFENTTENSIEYGKPYNSYAMNDNQNIAPDSWHVLSENEWQTFVDYLGGKGIAGFKLKERGTSHWNAPDIQKPTEAALLHFPVIKSPKMGNSIIK